MNYEASRPLPTRATLEQLWLELRGIFKMPPSLSVSQWAEQYRVLSPEAHSTAGKWRSLPFQVEPMDSVHDPRVESTSLQWAAQIGKTEILNNIIGFHIHQDPCPLLKIDPTLEMAEAWSKDRLAPMVRDTPVLRGLLKDARTRDSGNTILHKTFPGGHYTGAGANSPASLASRPIRGTLFDEIDRFPVSAGAEGDPMSLAKMRTASFHNAFSISVSTPTIRGASRIEAEMELSDKRKWFCPCPECTQFQVLGWHQVKWPEGKPEEAYLECDHCHAVLTDQQREEMVRAGEWRETVKFNGKRGYYLNGINILFKCQKGFKNRLHQMAAAFLDAKARGPESLKTWTNTFLGETWEDDAQSGPLPELIYSRREPYGMPSPDGGDPVIVLPERCVVLVAFGDVQQDRIEIEVMGAGEGEETWNVDYRVFKGNVERWELWNEADEFIQGKYRHASGIDLAISAVGFDSGHKSKIVQSFVRRCSPRRVFATKGVGTSGIPWVVRSRKQPILLLKINSAKEAIYSRLNLDSPGPGYMHFPMTRDLEYFRQLTSEKVVTRFRFGMPVKSFEQSGRNEALDCRVGCMAMLETLRPNYPKIAAQITSSALPEEEPPTPEPRNPDRYTPLARPRMSQSGGKWMAGFGRLR
jgi:phage terminase large subunit GpA-like protein